MAEKNKGWRNEPARHSLAARGKKTIPAVVDYHGGHYGRMGNLIEGKKSVSRGYDDWTNEALSEIRRAGEWNEFDGEQIVNHLLEYNALWEAVRLDIFLPSAKPGEFSDIFIYPKEGREMDLVIMAMRELRSDDLEWVEDQNGNRVLRAWWD